MIINLKGAFFSRDLPGSILLIDDFIHAAEKVASSAELDDRCPRVETQAIISSIIFIVSERFHIAKDQDQITHYSGLKTRIAEFIILSCRRDPAGQARCVAFR